MLFNPLFIQSTGQADASSSLKQTKLNSTSYLFSDIIKIIKENTIGETPASSTSTGSTSANVTDTSSNSSDSVSQLLTLTEDKTGTEDISISLNDLLKNLLISSNSDQIKDSTQVDSSSKKSTVSNKLTSALSKSDIEKLMQSLAAVLVQLNISPDSLQKVLSGSSTNQDSTSTDSTSGTSNQSGNSIAELIINLSQDLKSTGYSQDSASSQSDAINSLYTTISTILANFTSNVSSDTTAKTSADDSNTDTAGQDNSTAIAQLASTLLNLYQNNNGLVINVKSGDNDVKIEIPGDSTKQNQADEVDNGAILNAQNQTDNQVKAGKQSVSEKTTANVQTTTDSKVSIAAATVGKVKESIPSGSDEIDSPLVVKTTTSPNNVTDSNVTIVSDQNEIINPVGKSENADTSTLKSEDKVTITVSSKSGNSDIQNSNVTTDNTSATKDVKSDIKIEQTTINNVTTAAKDVTNETEIADPTSKSSKASLKAGIKVSDNTGTKTPTDQGVKVQDDIKGNYNKTAKTSKAKLNSEVIAKDSDQTVDTQNIDDTTELSVNTSPKDTVKTESSHSTAKASLVNQSSAAINQTTNSSTELTDNTISVKQSSSEEVKQVINSNQENSSGDQQQKKSSDDTKSSVIKDIEQVAANFSTGTTDAVKEKFVNGASSSSSAEKTIKITEITKEITNIIQQNTSKSVVLQLKPESLGKIKVTIDITNNSVNARVEVDTEAVRQIVQNNTAELRQSLNSNGMQLSALSVNVSGGEQKPYQPFAQKKKSSYQSADKRIEDNVSLASTKSLGYNTYEYLI